MKPGTLALLAIAFLMLRNSSASAAAPPGFADPFATQPGADWLGLVAPDSGVPGIGTPPYFPSDTPSVFRSEDYGVYF